MAEERRPESWAVNEGALRLDDAPPLLRELLVFQRQLGEQFDAPLADETAIDAALTYVGLPAGPKRRTIGLFLEALGEELSAEIGDTLRSREARATLEFTLFIAMMAGARIGKLGLL